VVRLRVAVMSGWDGAAASKDEQEEEAQEEGLERVQLTATGVGRVENGAADVAHGEAVLRRSPGSASLAVHGPTRGERRPVDPDQLAAAREVADRAAAAADVEVVDLAGHASMHAAAALLDRVWGRGGQVGSVLAPEALTALADAGAQVSGAYRGDDLLGATAAFLGRHPDGRPLLHSHVTAAAPGAEGRGIGRALKWYQRSWCLERGIEVVRWTFDPLVRRNAVFNLLHLGARVTGFVEDLYGPMEDARNAGTPTDRLTVTWELTAPRVLAVASGRAVAPDLAALRRTGAQVALEVGESDRPAVRTTQAARRLVQIPPDIELLRTSAPRTAAAWTEAMRATLGAAIGSGFRVSGVTRDGWYVLAAAAHVDELKGPR
jgi:predicted GNAT superfamily acetyltransferase